MSDARGDPDVHFPFRNDVAAAREAREAMAPLFPDPADPIADDVGLTVSELVTNVIKHTTAGGLLEAWDPTPDVPLRLEVSDSDPSLVAPVAEARDLGGLGLRIVDQVADDWGVDVTDDGKTVWAEFNRNARAQPQSKRTDSECSSKGS